MKITKKTIFQMAIIMLAVTTANLNNDISGFKWWAIVVSMIVAGNLAYLFAKKD